MSWKVHYSLMPVLLALAFPFVSDAQGPPSRAAGRRIFDPATVRTLEGEVTNVQRIPSGRRYAGVHVTLATAQESIDVHLGPEWYVDERLPKLAKGDRVEVKGSQVTLAGKPALIAQEIRRGDTRVELRDDAGVPLWSRARRR